MKWFRISKWKLGKQRNLKENNNWWNSCNIWHVKANIQVKIQCIQKYEKRTKFFRHNNIFQDDQNILPGNRKRDDEYKGNPYNWKVEIILE